MFIIPYIHNKSSLKDFTIHTISILCESGTSLWQEDDSVDIINDVLNENGLVLKSNYKPTKKTICNNPVYLCPIDPTKTNLDDFYNWDELDISTDTICWRKIINIYDSNKNIWINPPNILLNDIPIITLIQHIESQV